MYVLNLKGLLLQPVCVCVCVNTISVCLLYGSIQRCFRSVALPITFAICPISARRNLWGQILLTVFTWVGGWDSRAQLSWFQFQLSAHLTASGEGHCKWNCWFMVMAQITIGNLFCSLRNWHKLGSTTWLYVSDLNKSKTFGFLPSSCLLVMITIIFIILWPPEIIGLFFQIWGWRRRRNQTGLVFVFSLHSPSRLVSSTNRWAWSCWWTWWWWWGGRWWSWCRYMYVAVWWWWYYGDNGHGVGDVGEEEEEEDG